MNEGTQIWTQHYRGIEIQLWRSGARWFACAPGQECCDNGHRTLSRALEYAEDFVDARVEDSCAGHEADEIASELP
jgi:hypothetical protein